MRDRLGRFVPGSSGNPNGRPRRRVPSLSVEQDELDFFEVMNAQVTVVENGRQRKVTVKHAITKQLSAQAIKGNMPAIIKILNENQRRIENRERRVNEWSTLLLEAEQRVREQPENVSDDFLDAIVFIRKRLEK